MKKVIERMDGNVREMQRRARAAGEGGAGGGGAPVEKGREEKKGGGSRWLGLGKKKDKDGAGAGAGAKDGAGEGSAGADADDEGLRVEQYLLVFLKFISTISASLYLSLLLGLSREPELTARACSQRRPSRSTRRRASCVDSSSIPFSPQLDPGRR